jgi:hypothetical protein
MTWNVALDDDFHEWLEAQDSGLKTEIYATATLLETRGPNLGRPYTDQIKNSQFANMKELRIQWQGAPWRVLFAFDPRRAAILLVGGCTNAATSAGTTETSRSPTRGSKTIWTVSANEQ